MFPQALLEILRVPDVDSPRCVRADHVNREHVLRKMAPEVGFEPTTNRLTADRSTTELLRSVVGKDTSRDVSRFKRKLSRAFRVATQALK